MLLNMLEVLLVFIVFDRFLMCLFFFIRCVCWVMFMRVLVVLNMCMKRKVRIMLIMVMLNVLVMFIVRRVGVRFGGVENILLYCIRLRVQLIRVMLRMLMRMLLNIWWYLSMVIIRKYSVVSSGLGEVRWLSLIRVVGLVIMMLVVFRLIRLRNRLIFVFMVNLRLWGMLLSSYLWIWEKVSSMNIILEMNIVFRVICQLQFMVLIMVQVKKVFSFIFGVRFIGQLVYRFIRKQLRVVVRYVVMNVVLWLMLVLVMMLGLMKMMQVMVMKVVSLVVSLVLIVVLCWWSLNRCLSRLVVGGVVVQIFCFFCLVFFIVGIFYCFCCQVLWVGWLLGF